jgi:hypothetical protein
MYAWLVVALVGVFVVAVVFGLSLFPRLSAAQRVVDNGSPAFTNSRVAGDRAGVTMISHAVDTLTPITTPQGGASSEVPQLVAFVSKQTGLSQAQVLAALQKNFPHTTALLQAIPLSSVNSEIPKLVTFLSTTLHVPPATVLAGLKANDPAIYQSITNLPYVTNGWNNVPGTAGLTRYDGSPVRTVPQVRDYYSQDVIPVLEDQKGNFQNLASGSGVSYLAPLLLTIGIVVIIFAVAMALFARNTMPRELAGAAWGVVTAVGAMIVVGVLVTGLFPRLDGGQNLLDQAQPAFSQSRVAGDAATMTMVGHVIDFAAPAVTPQGGAASEVPQLVASVSKQTGLSQAQVLGALTKNFPHTTALLEALPLSSVTAEIPKLVSFLGTTLHLSDAQVLAALKSNFPDLYQSITNLPYVTGGWNNIPGTAGLTNFNGQPVHSVPQMGAYLSGEVVPYLAGQGPDYRTVVSDWPRIPVFPPLLLTVGIIVILYGLTMFVLSVRRPRPVTAGAAPPGVTPSPTPTAT